LHSVLSLAKINKEHRASSKKKVEEAGDEENMGQ
jgi:hypothetical protein